ncbi:MAG TPA: type II secretion system protein M [Spongiibacteraceae bacterium]
MAWMDLALLQRGYQSAIARYRELASRERRFVLLTATAIGVVALYILILKPALNFYDQARVNLGRERAVLSFVQEHADTVRQMNRARQAKTGQDTSLLALASKTATENQLILQRYEPNTDGKLSVWLSEAEFNTLLTWMDQLVHQYNVQIEHANISASTRLGTVEVQLVLRQ